MGKKKSWMRMGGRTWRMVRLALIWFRKGGALHRRLTDEFGFVFSRLKHRHCSQRLHYGEHEFSFDDTPCFRFQLHRSSSLSFAYDFNDHDDHGGGDHEDDKNIENEKNAICFNDDDDDDDDDDVEGIDEKAEEFIAKFYQQMKLQHQVSLLEYNEMLHRSIS